MIVFTAREEQKIRQKRYEALMMEYPGMVMKFTLLVQAGMTVRNAFVKMAADYKKKKDKKQNNFDRFGNMCTELRYMA